jgi:two-component system, chemotaxis family, protein-glutamate methylesterase/glutaminase
MSYTLVVIGASWGGLDALSALLGAISERFTPAMAVALHRDKRSDQGLVTYLQQRTMLPVREPEDKEPIVSGTLYLAPADYHLLVDRKRFALSTEAPVAYARPSIDALFESASESYGPELVGLVLTGANQDGAAGLAAIKRRGGLTLVQDPATAEKASMPEAAIAAAPVDRVLGLNELGELLAKL